MSTAIIKRRPRRNRKAKDNVGGVGKYAEDAFSLAKRTAYGLNEIRKLINIETKFFDFFTNTTFSTSTGIGLVSAMAQGLTSTTRVGDSLRLQHVECHFAVTANNASSGARVRITLIRDLDCAGTSPTAALVYENVSTGPASLVSPLKYNEKQRFSVLYDEILTVCNGTFAVDSVSSFAHNGHILFLGTGATAADCGKGSMFLLITSSETANLPTVSAYTRILYTDD